MAYLKRNIMFVALTILTFSSIAFASTPSFKQQFTTIVTSSNNGYPASNMTMYWDFPGQRERLDTYQSDGSLLVSVYYYDSQLSYAWGVQNQQVTYCVYFNISIQMTPFAWPSGLTWWGESAINGIECDEYIA
jgi:hypothetical protein